ncbi:MAG: spermidine synthase, partial [Nitrospirales bacterium]
LQVDTVEVDPSVVRAAEAFFAYRPATGHRVFVQDARAFLRDTDLRYDVIWVDVLARHLIPFHLTTREFFAELRAHVGPDGVVAVNLASSSLQGDRLRAEAIVSTLRTAFPNLVTFAVKGPWDSKTEAVNVLFFVGPGVPIMETPTFATRVQDLLAVRRLPQQVPRLLRERYARPWGHGLVLTDDFAPFDLLGGSWGSNPGASAGETE